jgi:predicted RNase H-like HicB family nuclease
MAGKKCLKKQVLKYTALFEAQKAGGFTVTIPALPGCISEGDTYEKAIKNIKEAMALYLEDVSCKDIETNYSPSESFVAPVEVCLV